MTFNRHDRAKDAEHRLRVQLPGHPGKEGTLPS